MTLLRLIVLLTAVLPGDTVPAAGLTLQPVSDDAVPLRSVPSPVVYRPAWSAQAASGSASRSSEWSGSSRWSETSGRPRVLRMSATVRSGDGSSDAGGPTESRSRPVGAGQRPFLDLSQRDSRSEAEPMASGRAETSDMFVRLAVWTVIVLGLCVLTVLGLRRWQQRQGILPSGSGTSRILETLALGPGRAVSLVQLGDVQAMVGTDGGGIRTIVLVPPAFEEQLSHYGEDGTDDGAPAV